MKLSVITVNYNNLDGLKRTAESILYQTWKDFEWIMGDYLEDMIAQGSLEEDLKSLGWTAMNKSFKEPEVLDMANNNEQLKDGVNKGDYRQINIDKFCPAFA